MPWLIVGTVPRDDFPLIHDRAMIDHDRLIVGGHRLSIARGTPALVAATCMAGSILGGQMPEVLLCGDTGRGTGSSQIYRYLVESGVDLSIYSGMTFHYLQPDVDWHNRILLAVEALAVKPVLIADAGYMYVAKMSGYAESYDLFTPDAGELAFLADERAPHPFYTRGFLLHEENRIPDLIDRAISQGNAARNLLIKGQADVVVSNGKIVKFISEPCVESMEPIGGTGDSLVGLVTALVYAGMTIQSACIQAARINRYMGFYANPTPAFSIADLLKFLPQSMGSSS
jgi:hypothetical protein